MSDFISWNITGLQAIQLRLNALPEKIKRKHIRSALAAGAEVIRAEAARLAPRRKPKKPGHGWEAFVTDSRVKLHEAVVSKVVVGPVTGAVAVVGLDYSKVHHGHLLEFGTRAHDVTFKTLSGRHLRTIHIPAMRKQPFMRPAFDNKSDEAVEIIVNRLMAAVDLEA
jgi:HK97 gp10 family phage protein